MTAELILAGLGEYGTKEIPGTVDNPKILQWAKDCGFNQYAHDEVAWCSLFVNYICQLLGYQRSKNLVARSWLEIGSEVTNPVLGDICILWRDKPDSIYGHVGFYINQDAENYYLLSGNQNNMVNITAFSKEQLLGFRRLQKS